MIKKRGSVAGMGKYENLAKTKQKSSLSHHFAYSRSYLFKK
jgi:hypothetical protein